MENLGDRNVLLDGLLYFGAEKYGRYHADNTDERLRRRHLLFISGCSFESVPSTYNS